MDKKSQNVPVPIKCTSPALSGVKARKSRHASVIRRISQASSYTRTPSAVGMVPCLVRISSLQLSSSSSASIALLKAGWEVKSSWAALFSERQRTMEIR